jgi:hypothetical protein
MMHMVTAVGKVGLGYWMREISHGWWCAGGKAGARDLVVVGVVLRDGADGDGWLEGRVVEQWIEQNFVGS